MIVEPAGRAPARGQQYPSVVAHWFTDLVVRSGVALRAAGRTLEWLGGLWGLWQGAPDWTTCRWWLLRIGLAALRSAKVVADDWVWLVDHSIQIGQCKCLVILGVRASEAPVDRPLRHEDLQLIALEPMVRSTKETVAECLERAVEQTGVPCAILSDHGAELHGAAELFRARHRQTIELYDVKHKAACLLKAQLKDDQRWTTFASSAGNAKFSLQQTEMACVAPPSQRSKARFMNLAALTEWGRKTLALLDEPAALQRQGIARERIEQKLGWLREFRSDLKKWSAYHEVIGRTLEFMRLSGFRRQAWSELAEALPGQAIPQAAELRKQLILFVKGECSKLRDEQRLPATTEVLESSFGKLKDLEDDQSKSGFTGLVLSLGAMVSNLTPQAVHEALESVRVRDVIDWCQQKLGPTVQSQRKQLYALVPRATKTA